MVVALIIAGGRGQRMGADIPKQFVKVYGKPVLFYTLEAFQASPIVDAIALVCIDGWHETVRAYANQYNLTKLKWLFNGGDSAQESIRNGVYALESYCKATDIVVIHDGVRPLVDSAVLDDVISLASVEGNAVSSMPYNEQIFLIDESQPQTTTAYIPRERLRRVSTPQAYQFGLLNQKYHEAFEKKIGIFGSSYTNTMMVELGVRLNFAAGSDRNIKLTTRADIDIFKALLDLEQRG